MEVLVTKEAFILTAPQKQRAGQATRGHMGPHGATRGHTGPHRNVPEGVGQGTDESLCFGFCKSKWARQGGRAQDWRV